jgi:hypothetical protein
MTMTPHDLDMMLELAHTHAKHIIIKCNQQLMPSWLVIDARNKGHVIGTPWKDDDEKQIMIAEVRLFMQDHGARAYSFITEVWMAGAFDYERAMGNRH